MCVVCGLAILPAIQEQTMKTLRPYQKTAVSKIVRELNRRNRTKCIMPCGTGKTLVAISAWKRRKPRRSLVVAPSLALLKQLLDEYVGEAKLPRVLVVCSDDSTARDAREQYHIPGVTTDPKEIRSALRAKSGVIVFCTYQSTPKLAEAVDRMTPWFDLAIFDEAHRLAGNGVYSTAMEDSNIKIRKRLFLTATPRISKQGKEEDAEIFSMDNESQFGREAFYLSFNEAIKNGWLTDYRVSIFVIRERQVRRMMDRDEDVKALAKRIALAQAISKYKLRKTITYHRSLRSMNQFASHLFPDTFEKMRTLRKAAGYLWCKSLDGGDNAQARQKLLSEFASKNGRSRCVLNNCRVLQEGVDCPSIDAVCLIDPKSQPIDIVQIVGRAIRNSPDKKQATIVLPVFMPQEVEDDPEGFIASSEFSGVWEVLSALKSHDERIQGFLSASSGNRNAKLPENIDVEVSLGAKFRGAICNGIAVKMVRRLGERRPLTEELVWQWMVEHRDEHGRWPANDSKHRSPDGSGWSAINTSLSFGHRGLPGGSSLATLRRKIMGEKKPAPLTEEMIWKWMQAYHAEHKRWPTSVTTDITPGGSTWNVIDNSLRTGRHGLPGGSSLAQLRRKINKEKTPVLLTEWGVWKWMRSFYKKHGKWPTQLTTELASNGSTWSAVDEWLRSGRRGLPEGASLPKLRKKMLGEDPAPLTEKTVWKWMQKFREEHGRWPTVGTRSLAPNGSTWASVDRALAKGYRGLPGGMSLAKLRKRMLGK